ncbi:MAG: winged helix DNA-binding domain-containing protein, partial [Acidimicrobiia bacterium]
LGMRRTMFVVDHDVAAMMDAACTQALAPAERRKLVQLVEQQGHASDGAKWLRRVEELTMRALDELGEATATELSNVVPDLKLKVTMGVGKTWGADVGISTRVLFLLAAEGRIVRARPKGSWISSQYRWATTEQWIGPFPDLDRGAARAELVRRWLRSFGPGTLADVSWWTGWGQRDTRAALEAVHAVEVELETGAEIGYLLPDDLAPDRAPKAWVAFLPALDPTVMGWKQRDWYLGSHAPQLFDRNGNAGPTVWASGEIVGGWAQRADGEVVVELLADVAKLVDATIDCEAQALTDWLSGTRVTPRFRTPIEKALSTT